ncbi:MAG: hypothetical protein Q4F09_06430 [Erysipelotrichaceae bacterium]|nr:hypothetical protein [Erysipelotrichaceae bacterium]
MLKKEYRILLCIALMLPSIPNFPGMGSLHLFGAYCGLIASCLITLLFLWRYQQKYLMPYIALLFLLTVLYSGEFVVTSLMEWLYLNADLLLAWYAGEKNCIFDLFSVK